MVDTPKFAVLASNWNPAFIAWDPVTYDSDPRCERRGTCWWYRRVARLPNRMPVDCSMIDTSFGPTSGCDSCGQEPCTTPMPASARSLLVNGALQVAW